MQGMISNTLLKDSDEFLPYKSFCNSFTFGNNINNSSTKFFTQSYETKVFPKLKLSANNSRNFTNKHFFFLILSL